jgi:hypothetical protein
MSTLVNIVFFLSTQGTVSENYYSYSISVVPQWFHGQRRVQWRIQQQQQQQQQTAGAVVSAPDIPGAAVPGRVGKNPD